MSKYVKPKSQEELIERCGKGEQWCIECTKFSCCDNMHPNKPKITYQPCTESDTRDHSRNIVLTALGRRVVSGVQQTLEELQQQVNEEAKRCSR